MRLQVAPQPNTIAWKSPSAALLLPPALAEMHGGAFDGTTRRTPRTSSGQTPCFGLQK
jgi:hypothetical protein